MLSNEEKREFIDTHLENLIFVLRMHLNMSEEDVLEEIERRVKSFKTKKNKV